MDKHPDKTLLLSGGNTGRAGGVVKRKEMLFTFSMFPAAKSQGSTLMTYICTDIKFIMVIMCHTLPLSFSLSPALNQPLQDAAASF